MDFIALIAGLVERLHGMLLAKHGIELNDQTINLPNDQFKTDDIDRLIRLLSRAYLETKTSFIPSLPLELAVIEYCNT